MNYKEFEDYLARYTAYSFGDLSQKCVLQVQNEKIENFDFSKYDLNNSFFIGVEFDSCIFQGVYLSGSFFGGSSFKSCILENNTLRKADWNGMIFQKTTIKRLDAFRSSFYRDTFQECVFQECKIGVKCDFWHSQFTNVFFDDCNFEEAFLDEALFSNVYFRNCKFKEVSLPKGFDLEKATGSEYYFFNNTETF